MQFLDKDILLQDINKKNIFAKLPFTYFGVTPIQLHFAKETTLGFSVITKLPFLLAPLNFQKLHTNINELYTNKHIFHTNK
jgi:hypothetical protein